MFPPLFFPLGAITGSLAPLRALALFLPFFFASPGLFLGGGGLLFWPGWVAGFFSAIVLHGPEPVLLSGFCEPSDASGNIQKSIARNEQFGGMYGLERYQEEILMLNVTVNSQS